MEENMEKTLDFIDITEEEIIEISDSEGEETEEETEEADEEEEDDEQEEEDEEDEDEKMADEEKDSEFNNNTLNDSNLIEDNDLLVEMIPKNEERTCEQPTKMPPKDRSFLCPICGNGFTRKYDVTRHLLTHTKNQKLTGDQLKNVESENICEICGKYFGTNYQLRRHILIHQSPEKRDNRRDPKKFPCPICKLKFLSKGNLLRHMPLHSDERPFKCDLCDYAAKRKDYYVRHQNVHMKKII